MPRRAQCGLMSAAVLLLFFPGPVIAEESAKRDAVTGHCLLSVDGKKLIDGPCRINTGADGSFDFLPSEEGNPYFAYVSVVADGVAKGFYNGEPPQARAHDPLGDLTKHDGCWQNQRARVCAGK